MDNKREPLLQWINDRNAFKSNSCLNGTRRAPVRIFDHFNGHSGPVFAESGFEENTVGTMAYTLWAKVENVINESTSCVFGRNFQTKNLKR
jgi:hypothetical protein